jgi:hypothetical protein
MHWQADVLRRARAMVRGDPAWERAFDAPATAVHLAVFVEPHLSKLMSGAKTIESRFATVRRAPYEQVRAGNLVLVKRASGPVVGIFRAGRTWFYELDERCRRTIRRDFSASLCVPPEAAFGDERKHARFATLIGVGEITPLPPIDCAKRDRRGGWC